MTKAASTTVAEPAGMTLKNDDVERVEVMAIHTHTCITAHHDNTMQTSV